MFKVKGNMINLNLDLVEMGVHNEGADEDKDEDSRETHFEKLRTSHLVQQKLF